MIKSLMCFSLLVLWYHFSWHQGLKILLFPNSQITCRWCFQCVCTGSFYFHFLFLIKPGEQYLVFMIEVLRQLTSFFLWTYICFVANLVGDEKCCGVRKYFFIHLPLNVSFFRARNACPMCRGRGKHNAGGRCLQSHSSKCVYISW